jgi:branched-chain amino acid transport system substrate-binding protein
MAKYFWKMGIRKLAVIYVSDPAGADAVEGLLIPMWTKMGGEIVAVEPHEAGLTEYGPHLSRIKAKNPDAIYNISTGTEMAYIVKGARELGLTCPIHVVDWNHDYQAIAGKTSENVYCCNDLFDPTNPNPLTQRFVKDFEKRWSEPTDFYSANQYDGVHIHAELIKRVVAKGGNPLDGAQLESAIWDNPRFDTVYGGKLEFLKNGTVKKAVVISKIEGGKSNVLERVVQE